MARKPMTVEAVSQVFSHYEQHIYAMYPSIQEDLLAIVVCEDLEDADVEGGEVIIMRGPLGAEGLVIVDPSMEEGAILVMPMGNYLAGRFSQEGVGG